MKKDSKAPPAWLWMVGGILLCCAIGNLVPDGKPPPRPSPTPTVEGLIYPVAAWARMFKGGDPVAEVIEESDWAKGKRRTLLFQSGDSILLYLKSGAVVAGYRRNDTDGRFLVFGKGETGTGPGYKLLDKR